MVQQMALAQDTTNLEFICDDAIDDLSRSLSVESVQELLGMSIEIDSTNNFNTAAGLASSSSGLSCLGIALANLYGLQQTEDFDFSVLARLGSGSAVRSVYGGFVRWNRALRAQYGFWRARKAAVC